MVHEGISRLKCIYCSRTFASKTSLDYHLKKQNMSGSEIPCDICDQTLTDFQSYQIHKKSYRTSTFSQAVKRKCSDCEEPFSS